MLGEQVAALCCWPLALLQRPHASHLQVGGTTRDVFYYPAGTLQVTVGGADLNLGALQRSGGIKIPGSMPVSVLLVLER